MEFLRHVYDAAIIHHLPVAVWRLPLDIKKQAIVDLGGRRQPQPLKLHQNTSGFVIAPFVNSGGKISYFLRSHILWRDGKISYLENGSVEDAVRKNRSRFESTLERLLSANNGRPKARWHVNPNPGTQTPASKNDFIAMVAEAVNRIHQGEFKKVVLSQILERNLDAQFDPVDLFCRLADAFPGAFVSLVALPEIGTWIGATPELHVSINDEQLRTVALAGTMPVSALDAKWGLKEMEEQAIVSEYIRACFHRHNMRDAMERGPETVRVGDLLHLQTTFKVNFQGQNNPDVLNRLLHDLHPTPAVCGLPKERALQHILKTEAHAREFYSGFLGPVNFDGQSHLFVNLRCLQLLAASAVLYAGVGITKDSVPENEWVETQLKFNALLKLFDLVEDGSSAALFSPAKEIIELQRR